MTETSYSKGEEFEKLFAEFMKSDLGWDSYRIRSQQRSGQNSKGSQVDIIGKRQDKRGKRLEKLSYVYYVIAIGVITGWVLTDEIGLLVLGIIVAAGSIISALISRDKHKENAWVECKNRKTKSTYDDVRKSIDEFNSYKAIGDKEYKYVIHYFVSANGFVDTALKCAYDNGIICYTYKNGNFEIEPYWK